MVLEQLWKKEELGRLEDTIDTLRRMRAAATGSEQTTWARISRVARKNRQEPPSDATDVLAQAQGLADIAGEYVGAKLSKGLDKMPRYWDEALEHRRDIYKHYPAITSSGTSKGRTVLNFMKFIRLMDANPSYIIKYLMTEMNHLGHKKLKDLRSDELRIVAPLSTDYLMLATINGYYRAWGRSGFNTQAIALSQDHSKTILPRKQERSAEPTLLRAIGIFQDSIDTGSTGHTIYQALQEAHPKKHIYTPNQTAPPFSDTERIVNIR